jgi:hypothetical protein
MPASGGHLIYTLLIGAARTLPPARSLSLRLTLGLLLLGLLFHLTLGFFLSLLLYLALSFFLGLLFRFTLGFFLSLLLYLTLGLFLGLLSGSFLASLTHYLAFLRNLAFRFLARNFLSRCSHYNSLRVGITGPSIYIRN